ncbi:type IV secretion system protein VirB3 [Bartonella chomelii]|uniref:Type IV secretion system protein VirB3 n=1 Tax=Bartonella chomelii TaxID=236402 RepID=A0ABR6E463_9HYPH|nr:conjugal transfer protein TrbD [Bartonella chomelii]MBA9083337.1 type IV secretion system protein VirB3 [Bartonella chomelii]
MDEELRCTPIYRFLYEPKLIMGVEREPVLILTLLIGVFIISAMSIVATIIGMCIWLIGLYVLRKMAKIDPMLFRVYIHYLRYQRYYPARSSPFRVARSKWPY